MASPEKDFHIYSLYNTQYSVFQKYQAHSKIEPDEQLQGRGQQKLETVEDMIEERGFNVIILLKKKSKKISKLDENDKFHQPVENKRESTGNSTTI